MFFAPIPLVQAARLFHSPRIDELLEPEAAEAADRADTAERTAPPRATPRPARR